VPSAIEHLKVNIESSLLNLCCAREEREYMRIKTKQAIENIIEAQKNH